MLRRIDHYFIKQIAVATVFVTMLLTTALWLTQSLRFVDLVLNRGLSLKTLFLLVSYLLPDLISLVLPISVLIATIFVYQRAYQDQELVVLKATGRSLWQLTRPAFWLAGVAMTFLYAINLYILPLSFQQFRTLELHVRDHVGSHLVQPGEFLTINKMTLYVRHKHPNGQLDGIFVYDLRNLQKPLTLIAERGLIYEDTQGVHVIMLHGSRHEKNYRDGKPTVLHFERYSVDLNNNAPEAPLTRSLKPYERFLPDLLAPQDVDAQSPHGRKLFAEAHQRILMPWTLLSFLALTLGLFLKGDFSRRGRQKKIFLALGICALLQVLLMSCFNLYERTSFALYGAYALVFGSLFMGARLLQERDKS